MQEDGGEPLLTGNAAVSRPSIRPVSTCRNDVTDMDAQTQKICAASVAQVEV